MDYQCPRCDGGFPENPDKKCPWCGLDIDGSYSDSPNVGYTDLFDHRSPPDGLTRDLDIEAPEKLDNDPGTTTCPECGDKMPLVSWTGKKPLCSACARKNRTVL